MNRKGVCYDVGTVFSGFAWRVRTRPVLSPDTIRRELQIVKDELHCNAVRITGHDVGRLITAAETALRLGLEVWLSPGLYEHGPDQTLAYYLTVARAAEDLRVRYAAGPAQPRPPAAEDSLPAAEQCPPAAEDSRPAAEHCPPAAEDFRPAAEQCPPAAEDSRPAVEDCRPGAGRGAHPATARCAQCPGQLCRRVFPAAGPQVSSQVVFCVGGELSLFMRGIVPGRSIPERVANLFAQAKAGSTAHSGRLNAFLGRASERIREVFGGPLSYASLAGESVDWGPFDFVGVDHYRDSRIKDGYADMLQPFFATGKPVVVTEVGMRGYQGAEDSGTLGFGVIDQRSQFLHQLPVVGRLVRTRLNGAYVRDEGLQARELTEILGILGRAGVDGVFVNSFVDPLCPHHEDPRYDLDMSAMSLVKSYTTARGVTYPDMPWEPKQAFRAVAGCYASQSAGV